MKAMNEIKTYEEMNKQICGLLRLAGDNVSNYAAQRINELESEIASLRARLENAVELPCVKMVKTKEWIDRVEVGDILWEWAVVYIDRQGDFVVEPCRSKTVAKTRLEKLKGDGE